MSIDPVQTNSQAITADLLPGKGSVSKSVASGFESVLNSVEGAEGGASSNPRQAAAELLRMEMMQASLMLAGEDGGASSGHQAVQSLLSALTGNDHSPPVRRKTERRSNLVEAVQGEGCDADADGQAGGAEIGGIGETAAGFLGIPYRFGGEGETGIDCSSLVQQVFREHEISLPRTAREQMKIGREVADGDLQKGDLLFFHTYASYPSHVGIYLGDGKMIHASSERGEVAISDIKSEYYRSRFIGARRVA